MSCCSDYPPKVYDGYKNLNGLEIFFYKTLLEIYTNPLQVVVYVTRKSL